MPGPSAGPRITAKTTVVVPDGLGRPRAPPLAQEAASSACQDDQQDHDGRHRDPASPPGRTRYFFFLFLLFAFLAGSALD